MNLTANGFTKRQFSLLAACLLLTAISCNQASSTKNIANADLVQAVAGIGQIIEQAQKYENFELNVGKIGEAGPSGFATTLSKNMSDSQFVFFGQEFSNLKEKMSQNRKALARFTVVERHFSSINEVFAAHGLTGRINSADIEAYLKVASIALNGLSRGIPISSELKTGTLARALHVVVALSAIPTETTKAGLNLSNPGTIDTCGAISSSAGEKKDWFCFTDTVGGSIGIMGLYDENWQDAFSGKTFTVCPAANEPSSGSWGWVPDASVPGGGTSCHMKNEYNDGGGKGLSPKPTGTEGPPKNKPLAADPAGTNGKKSDNSGNSPTSNSPEPVKVGEPAGDVVGASDK